jgi:MYXO-CTERM domain-containing protein
MATVVERIQCGMAGDKEARRVLALGMLALGVAVLYRAGQLRAEDMQALREAAEDVLGGGHDDEAT